MTSAMRAILLGVAIGVLAPAFADESPAEMVKLKDGTTLYVQPDGSSRMVDQQGKPMTMADGVEMETADGRKIMMMNKHVWVRVGPPGKESTILKHD